MSADTALLLRYAAVASVAAAALFYVLGPSLIPNEHHESLRKHNAVGLANPGNDCFINSTIQALAASDKLRAYLGEGRQATEEFDGSNNAGFPIANIVTKALADVLGRIHDPAWKGRTTSASGIILALELAFSAKLSRRQQDAQEFLQFVVQKLHDEAVARAKTQGGTLKDGDSSSLPMLGKLKSQIECLQCHYCPSAAISDFLVLSLNVPQQSTTSLDACFDGLLKQEVIEDYVCAQCKMQSVLAQQQQRLSSTSDEAREAGVREVETLQQAVDEDVEKASEDPVLLSKYHIPKRTITKHTRIARIAFEETLKLGTFDAHDYRLVSVVTHRGGHNSGHYETFRRQPHDTLEQALNKPAAEDAVRTEKPKTKRPSNLKWWGISDDKVRECRTQDVLALQRECYLLFYEQVDIR